MILVNTRDEGGLARYGIQVPVMPKTADLVFERLAGDIGPGERPEWMIGRDQTFPTREDLERAHDSDYVSRILDPYARDEELKRAFELIAEDGSYHRYDPSQAEVPLGHLFDHLLDIAGGSIQCMRRAMHRGFCFFLGGGMHHAMYDYGGGFCLINDIVIGIRALQATGTIRTAWVIDTDAHKGDGTAALTADDNSIVTLSIHMGDSWPLTEPRTLADGRPNPSFIDSNVEIPVYDGEEKQYTAKLSAGLAELDRYPRPDLVVAVYGADPYEHDELPSTATLRLSLDQMAERDRLVWEFIRDRGLPVAYLHSGGYGWRAWEPTAQFLRLRTKGPTV
ncbi:MAG: histone deacetylase [Spirochaetales bacterium]